MGGDEFLVLGFERTQKMFEQHIHTAELLYKTRKRSASLGWVFSEEGDLGDFENMLKAADKKMYADKNAFYEKNADLDRRQRH